jgi:prophage maintenance system killer protein
VLASPRAGFGGVEIYTTFAAKAAVLLYGLSKSQACPKGNKRIALILLRAFLHINGSRLATPDQEIAERIVRAANSDPADREDVIKELTGWLESAIEQYKEEQA